MHKILADFDKNNNKILSFASNQGRKPTEIPQQVLSFLLRPETLKCWSLFSLHKRVSILEVMKKVKLSVYKLRKIYRDNGIKYSQPQLAYLAEAKKDQSQLHKDRVLFARELQETVTKNPSSVVYIDEMSVNTWITKSKTWTRRDFPIKIPLPKRVGGVTVYGAIGAAMREPVFHLANSTNKLEFANFMRKVNAVLYQSDPVTKRGWKPRIVYDGHSAHRALASVELMEKGFHLLPMPPYSPEFNSIERLWAKFKEMFRRRIFAQAYEVKSTEHLQQLVQKLLDEIPHELSQRYCSSNRKDLQKWAEMHEVLEV